MRGKIRNFYAEGNTARGSYHLYESVLQGLDRLYIIKGGPGTGKSSLMKAVGKEINSRGYDIEWIHCPSDNNSIDGLLIPELKIGLVDGTAPHVIEPKVPGAVEEYINLGEAWNSAQLRTRKADIIKLNETISDAYEKAYDLFAQALQIHDEWECFYIENMDFTEANNITDEMIERIFANQKTDKAATIRHMFLGAATPQGPVDYIQNLTEDVKKRYFIKGRPGSGKSTMLKRLVAVAEERGYDAEVFHCGFDPNSLDMVIIPEQSVAIFDSTAPHEHFPTRENDEVLDMYARTIVPGTDEKYASELAEIKERYSAAMTEATSYLAEAKAAHDKLEEIYVAAMNFRKVETIKNSILDEINKIAEVQIQAK